MDYGPSALANDFSIQHSFWYYLNPARWTRRSLLVSFIVFYSIISIVYFLIAFQPATATESVRFAETSATTTSVLAESSPSSHLSIPEILIDSDIIDVEMTGSTLPTPDYLIGRYSAHENTTLLFAHSITAFSGLDNAQIGMTFTYDDATYVITDSATYPVADINMRSLLSTSDTPTLILMTCAGDETISGFNSRLIVTAHLLN